MTLPEAFSLYLKTPDWDKQEYKVAVERAFAAGWAAKVEADKQGDFFPETQMMKVESYEADGKTCFKYTPVARVAAPAIFSHILEAKAAANPLPTADDIYAAYPRKVGKQEAVKAIEKAYKSGPRQRQWYLDKVKAYAAATATWPESDKQFIPYPATWFNRGSYDDDPSTWQRGTPVAASQFGRSH